MKRGRPEIKTTVQSRILDILSSNPTPLTTITLSRICEKEFDKKISWNTIKKYLQKLVEEGKVKAIVLPHSKEKNKNGLTVYILKK